MKSEKELSQTFLQTIDQHKGILFKVAKIYCRNEDDRQDLLQDMMIQIWKSMHRYNPDFAITTWLYRICLNVAISFYRKDAKRQSTNYPLMDEHLSVYSPVDNERQEQFALLEQFILELNELDRALMLLYLEDKTHVEISVIMGLSVSNVGTKIARIREKIKKKFSQINQITQ